MANEWTYKEVAYLRKWYKDKTSAVIGEELGRTTLAVQQKMYKLGLESRKWSKRELDYLERNMGVMTVRAIAEKLGRSQSAVECKALRLYGYTSINLGCGELSQADVARLVGKHPDTIRRTWLTNGLTHKRVDRSILIKPKDLFEFMKANPDLWNALKCDKFYFEREDWFHQKLLAEREAAHQERWKGYI